MAFVLADPLANRLQSFAEGACGFSLTFAGIYLNAFNT